MAVAIKRSFWSSSLFMPDVVKIDDVRVRWLWPDRTISILVSDGASEISVGPPLSSHGKLAVNELKHNDVLRRGVG